MKKYILKELKYGSYFLDLKMGWGEDINLALFFDSVEDAEREMEKQSSGIYTVITIYMK
tara:strand:+ start:6174 stop:6350 length:177 start_codon:yes stop_codon:yes gene_type:complete